MWQDKVLPVATISACKQQTGINCQRKQVMMISFFLLCYQRYQAISGVIFAFSILLTYEA